MNVVYYFSFNTDKSEEEHLRRISASSYKNAIEKACVVLEELNDEVDLLGLDEWEDVQDECAEYGLYVSDLIEEDDV